MLDFFLFAIFPYVAITSAVIASIYRYFYDRFSYSSLSSQFLENRLLYWGSITFHYGIIIVLIAHLVAALFPSNWAAITGDTVRLYTLEITGLALGLLSVFGISILIARRFLNRKVKAVSSKMDWVLLLLLLTQVTSGVIIAVVYRWGSSWYLHTVVPWLWSLLYLDPQLQFIQTLPNIAKAHMFNALILIALIPFTRLVHLFTIPVTYLWRPYQVVIWNRRSRKLDGGKR
jgi:nitrate reductase gamma subunit